MSIKRIKDLPEGSGSLTNDDLFVFMDNPSGNGVTKKISLNQLRSVLGTGTGSSFVDVPIDDNITYGRRNQQWVDLTTPANLQIRRGTESEINQIIPLSGEPVWTIDTKNFRVGDGSTYGGWSIGLQDTDRYVFCESKDSIANKYAAAKALMPGGNVKSSGNRATLIVMPGIYNEPAPLNINEEFVDIIGLGSIKKYRGCACSVNIPSGINVTANNVRLIGLETSLFNIDFNKPLQIIENCKANESLSFGSTGEIAGTYINCEGVDASFGSVYSLLNGTFYNCKAGYGSFANDSSVLTGQFINCEAGDESFGFLSCTVSGIFENCIAGHSSFGGGPNSVSAGLFLSCRLTGGSFNPPSNGGKYRYCIDGNNDPYNNPEPTIVGG